MDYRRRKQTIIVLILIAMIALIGAGIYYKWFYQKPTCSDNKQNQKEEGVDCGGPCSLSCERLTLSELKVEWVKSLLLKDNTYDLAARIANPNPNFGLEQFKYTFKIYNEAGAMLKEQSGVNFILPAEKKYLIESNVATNGNIGRVDLIIGKAPKTTWKKIKQDFKSPDIYVHDKQFQYLDDRSDSAQASGVIKNNSDFDFDIITVAVVLFDENKEIIGLNKTLAKTILAGEERYFSVLWFTPFAASVKSIEMQAETNFFLDQNFMRRFGDNQEKFQEY